MEIPKEIKELGHQQQLGYLALKAFFKIVEDWNVDEAIQCRLLGKSVGLIELWQLKEIPTGCLDRDRLARIRCLVLIYRILAAKSTSISDMRAKIREGVTGAPFFGESLLKYLAKSDTAAMIGACEALT